MKLVSLMESPRKGKKWRALFSDGTTTDFGASAYDDYTQHGSEKRRALYRSRHWKDLKTGDPKKAGYLSMYILWNKPTLAASVRDYKRRLAIYAKTGHFPISF